MNSVDLPVLLIIYIAIPTMMGVVGFMLKTGIQSMYNRIDFLEKQELQKLSKDEFEIAMRDKLEPLKESVKEMKEKVDQVYSILLKQ